MTITVEQIDNTFKEVHNFEKQNFGLRNGEDFSAFATLLRQSQEFDNTVKTASLMGVLGTMLMPKKEEMENDKQAIDKFFQDSPMKQSIADVLYIGYRLGKAAAEVEQLQKLAS